ncbi:hypothetical protein [Pedobacter frigoris]|uniref:hypothetical protein n=1 Tax=Pedobacter frigoris TaxID=2571272 RepID=UPI002931C244|nr:hypothetical protein [Pedobacter frigoris]
MKNVSLKVSAFALLMFGCIAEVEKKDKSNLKSLVTDEILAENRKLLVDSLPGWGNKNLNMDIQQVEFHRDTLSFVTTGWFFYYPYGKHATIASFRKAYPQFTVIEEKASLNNDAMLLYRVKQKNSFVKLIYQPDTERMEIVSAKINDTEFTFKNGVKIGMQKEDFIKEFFSHPFSLKGYNHIKIISALDGINHNYHFEDNTLRSIELKTDYMFNQN